jgi:L-ribulokinase
MTYALNRHVLGIDFGTDSVRAVLFDVRSGQEVGRSVQPYERWALQKYCDASRQRFRQHPRDHAEAMTRAIKALFVEHSTLAATVVGIGVDTTGSSPLPLGRDAQPLAFSDEFADDPDAL